MYPQESVGTIRTARKTKPSPLELLQRSTGMLRLQLLSFVNGGALPLSRLIFHIQELFGLALSHTNS